MRWPRSADTRCGVRLRRVAETTFVETARRRRAAPQWPCIPADPRPRATGRPPHSPGFRYQRLSWSRLAFEARLARGASSMQPLGRSPRETAPHPARPCVPRGARRSASRSLSLEFGQNIAKVVASAWISLAVPAVHGTILANRLRSSAAGGLWLSMGSRKTRGLVDQRQVLAQFIRRDALPLAEQHDMEEPAARELLRGPD